jgi:magnesium chelatase family protein
MVTQGCPCGFFTDPQKECTCTPLQIQRYRSKVSGPLLDRIDIQVEVPTLRYQELASKDAGEPSAAIRQRVNGARVIQLQRFHKRTIHSNAQMGAKDIKRYCVVKEEADKLLNRHQQLGLSTRAYSRVSRTIADLVGSEDIHFCADCSAKQAVFHITLVRWFEWHILERSHSWTYFRDY